ncbi:MAG: hypothetical protein MUE54_06255, partial [Anaerolineae bacterium]|nr:hypothetical protein [Anaerolineae bacterium]
MRPSDEKYWTVIQKNTFYFFDADFEDQNEAQNIDILTTHLYNLYEKIQQQGVQKVLFDELMQKPYGLQAILALNGLSNETLKRIITIVRIVDDDELNRMMRKADWGQPINPSHELKEWGTVYIQKLAQKNDAFRGGLINLFF